MEYVRAARLLTKQAQLYLREVLPLARETFQSSFTTIYLIARLLHAIVRPLLSLLLQIYNVVFPAVAIVLLKLWSAFCLQPARVLAVEAAISIAVVFISYLERRFRFLHGVRLLYVRTSTRIRTKYRLFLSDIRAKSKLAALATPHIIFICLAFLFHSTIGKRLAYFLQGARLLVLACIRPAVRTALLLYAVDVESPETASGNPDSAPNPIADSSLDAPPESTSRRRRRASYPARRRRSSASSPDDARDTARSSNRINQHLSQSNDALYHSFSMSTLLDMPESEKEHEALELATLRFWIVFALAWAARSLFWYFCPAIFEGVLVDLDNFILYFLLWADLDITKGAETVYALISKTTKSRIRRQGRSRLEQLNIILRVLVATGVVSEDHAEDLSTVVAESGLALLGAVFLITPRMVTFVGTIAVGFILPCYLSQGVIESNDSKSFYRHNWLSYWSILYLLEIACTATWSTLGWLPLWYHVKLAVLLWLQLPYFRGATIVLDRVMMFLGKTMSSVHRQVVTPRKRKRA